MFVFDRLKPASDPSSSPSAIQAPVRCRSCGDSVFTERQTLFVVEATEGHVEGTLYHETTRREVGQVLYYHCKRCDRRAIIGG